MKRDKGEVFIEGKELESWDKKELSKKIAILKQSNNINIRLRYSRTDFFIFKIIDKIYLFISGRKY